jgi:glyoxylase-like metal-dependent hydrolase (beta-lactamase superfamily II)
MPREMNRLHIAMLATAALLLAAGCAPRARPMPPDATAARVTARTPDRSMVHIQRVADGFIVVDLGFIDAEDQLRRQLADAGGTPDDVRAVLLTHSHRDHIAAWRLVRHAPFYMGAAEVNRFFGLEEHEGWIPRLADRALGTPGPGPGEVTVRPIARDTALVFGVDTVHAFLMPGHTAGSVAWLMDGMLLAGDALYRGYLGDFRPAMVGYSDDTAEARRSAEALFVRLETFRVDSVCTAHGRCAAYDADFRARVLR